MSDTAIRVEHVSKEYRLGMIGGTTLRADLQRLWAKMRGKEDPVSTIGADSSHTGERFLALDDVSFEVKQGEALGIIGHNGAGKSTLLKLLARITAPTKGKISYNGRIASMLEVGTGFHGELTGRENIFMNGAILGMTKREIDRKLDEIVSFAEMEQFIDTPVKRYSSGMYVKLAFAVAAHLDAEIMIMDEVLAVGDMKFQQKCLGRMNDAAHNEGRTVLFVSHNMEAVRNLCTLGIVLEHGRIVKTGSVLDAVDSYMSQGNAVHGTIDLEQYPRKEKCRGKIKILSVTFEDTEKNIIDPAAGKAVCIHFRCEDQSLCDNVFEFAFSVSRAGCPMMHCKTIYHKPGKNRYFDIFCQFPDWPASEGLYTMNIFAGDGYGIFDWIVDIPFCVGAGRFFDGTPFHLEKQMGGTYLLVRHSWH